MIINNKIESLEYIKKLQLNTFPEKYFNGYDADAIREFIEKYKAEYYAVRDKSTFGSKKHKLAVPYNDVINYCADLNKFTINVSSYCYKEHQVCVGELIIKDDMEIEYIISNNKEYSLRDCYENPDYKGVSNLLINKLNNIKGIDIAIDYIFKHNLLNVVVEFTVFDIPVGLNNENVIIWELRTNY